MIVGTSLNIQAQIAVTPYDQLPGVMSINKPAYNTNYPDWAKMLYQYPINYNEIEKKFQLYSKEHEGEKNAIIRYYKVWRPIVSGYADSNGVIKLPSAKELKKASDKANYQRTTAKSADASNSQWTFLGPKNTFWLKESVSTATPAVAPWQVNVYSFDVFKGDPNILYCGTETGYVNKTVDGGQNWTLMAQNYVFSGVLDVVIHPTNSNIVYVSGGSQIHKTIDGGQSWSPMLAPDAKFSANHLLIDPSNYNKLVASSDNGIYISLDAGVTWKQKSTNKTFDFEFKPGDSNTIYTIIKSGTGNFDAQQSTDGGNTFTSIVGFPTGISEQAGGLIAVTAANPNLLLATMLSSNNTPQLYKGIIANGN